MIQICEKQISTNYENFTNRVKKLMKHLNKDFWHLTSQLDTNKIWTDDITLLNQKENKKAVKNALNCDNIATTCNAGSSEPGLVLTNKICSNRIK